MYAIFDELLFGNHFYYEFKSFAHIYKVKTQKSKVFKSSFRDFTYLYYFDISKMFTHSELSPFLNE